MPISFVLVDRDGHSEFVNYVTPFSERANPLSARSIEDADVALVDCRWPTGVIQALEAANNHGIPGVVDVDRPINPDPSTETGRIIDVATHRESCAALSHSVETIGFGLVEHDG